MENPNQPKSWHTCWECGDKFFPNCDKKLWHGITVMEGTCPDCGEKNTTLVPLDDWINQGD